MNTELFAIGDRVTWTDDPEAPSFSLSKVKQRYGNGPFTVAAFSDGAVSVQLQELVGWNKDGKGPHGGWITAYLLKRVMA